MRITSFVRNMFAQKSSAPLASTDPKTAVAIYQEQALTQLIWAFAKIPDVDDILMQAGITRASLSKLESDDEIFGALRTRRESCLATPWHVEDCTDEEKDFISAEMMPWMESLIGGAWKAVPYGYSVIEVVYVKRDDGKIGIQNLSVKPMEWFDIKRNGDLYYFHDNGSTPHGQIVDQNYKFFVTRHEATYKNPKGEALMSRLYWPWLMRYHGWQFWSQFLERYGQPLLVGKSAAPDKMAKALAAAIQDSVIACGKEDGIECLEPNSNGEAFQIFETVIVKRYHKLILGQTLTSDSAQGAAGKGAAGSLALGKVHADVADTLRKSDLRLIKPTCQRVITALMKLNNMSEGTKFVITDEDELDADRAMRDTSLYAQGVRFTKDYYMNAYGLNDEDFDMTQPLDLGNGTNPDGTTINPGDNGNQPPDPNAKQPVKDKQQAIADKNPSKNQKGAKAAVEPSKYDFAKRRAGDPRRFTPAQTAIENVADDSIKEAGQLFPVTEILDVIKASETPLELEHNLAKLLKGTDNQNFQMALEQALFLADVLGYANAEGKLGD